MVNRLWKNICFFIYVYYVMSLNHALTIEIYVDHLRLYAYPTYSLNLFKLVNLEPMTQ